MNKYMGMKNPFPHHTPVTHGEPGLPQFSTGSVYGLSPPATYVLTQPASLSQGAPKLPPLLHSGPNSQAQLGVWAKSKPRKQSAVKAVLTWFFQRILLIQTWNLQRFQDVLSVFASGGNSIYYERTDFLPWFHFPFFFFSLGQGWGDTGKGVVNHQTWVF